MNMVRRNGFIIQYYFVMVSIIHLMYLVKLIL